LATSAAVRTANTLPLVASELDNLAKLVDRALGDPYGTRVVVPI
jgi:hypothetical protein